MLSFIRVSVLMVSLYSDRTLMKTSYRFWPRRVRPRLHWTVGCCHCCWPWDCSLSSKVLMKGQRWLLPIYITVYISWYISSQGPILLCLRTDSILRGGSWWAASPVDCPRVPSTLPSHEADLWLIQTSIWIPGLQIVQWFKWKQMQ